MGAITITQGQTGYVVPGSDYIDSGWEISGGYATHYPCNPGYMTYQGVLPLVQAQQYDIYYTVDQYSSGAVYPLMGASHGTSGNTNGDFVATLTYDGNSRLQFYSDGFLRIRVVSIAPHATTVPGVTIAFNEMGKKFSSYYSYNSEMLMTFVNDFYSFKNGSLWLHNSNTNRNTFYGQAYPSKVTFYVNLDAEAVKNFYKMRQQSTSAWGSPNDGDINILPYKGKPNGQKSRLKAGNFRNLQGDFFANFLRDLSDPRFESSLDALFKGAPLQGKVMEITLENNDITEVRLVQVDIDMTNQNFTY